jgi:hypothetical protein
VVQTATVTVAPVGVTPFGVRKQNAWGVFDNPSSLGYRWTHVDLPGPLERLDPAVLDELATSLLV